VHPDLTTGLTAFVRSRFRASHMTLRGGFREGQAQLRKARLAGERSGRQLGRGV
jgi:hypothetical protein